jgi:hypothetical protein
MLLVGPVNQQHAHLQMVAKTVWTGQNHFLVHSKQPVKIAEATDRMLRMTQATEVSFVVSNLAEAKLLSRDWMNKVKALFDAHPKLGLVGGAALLVDGKPTKGTPGKFAFGEMAVGGPIAVRRKGYMQESVWLGSSETCGAGVGECKDPAQPLSSRMWAAGYQVRNHVSGKTTAVSTAPSSQSPVWFHPLLKAPGARSGDLLQY